jgi:carboxyl-terminal processing protease
MINGTNRRVNLWMFIIILVIFWTIGTGFYRDLSASNEETYKGLKIFADVIDLVEKTYVDEVDSKELIQNAIQGMVHSLDPHSAFLTADDFKELQVDTQGEFTGIGIQITMKDDLVTVISPIEGTPADKAGIQAGDKIVKVDGEAIKDLQEAVKKMRGPIGTKVTVTVLRKGEPEPLEFTLVREKIPIRSVKYSLLKPGYGFVRITNFSVNTSDELKEALKALESEQVPIKGLVLDLRNNPGGLLDQAVEVSDFFLSKGDIVSIKGREKRNNRAYSAHANREDRHYPLVVLINGGSASASEIVAGALQDNKRALILGTTSFGKGSVQSVETLRDGNGLKLTIARYYTPSGRSIQAQGIQPDIQVERRLEPLADHNDSGKSNTIAISPWGIQQIGPDGLHRLREKDLKNHLDAEPSRKDEGASKDGIEQMNNTQEPAEPSEFENSVGPLDVKQLLSDNQVIRAMEILVGYDILKAKDS